MQSLVIEPRTRTTQAGKVLRFAGSSGRWRHILGRYLVIEVARAPAAPRLVGSLLRRLFGCRVVVLADIYLVSLEEIAAKVEAYRDRAQSREA